MKLSELSRQISRDKFQLLQKTTTLEKGENPEIWRARVETSFKQITPTSPWQRLSRKLSMLMEVSSESLSCLQSETLITAATSKAKTCQLQRRKIRTKRQCLFFETKMERSVYAWLVGVFTIKCGDVKCWHWSSSLKLFATHPMRRWKWNESSAGKVRSERRRKLCERGERKPKFYDDDDNTSTCKIHLRLHRNKTSLRYSSPLVVKICKLNANCLLLTFSMSITVDKRAATMSKPNC